ncbi:ADP-ribosyl cyclase/cyclic ADP-ribose hydrolase-like [Ylistrum balloti]|uniref:ADP-ribosyl cyclase/cyclic ADP-ribose hydrolase-like n=1 Tax=Ylistrum balloti TaxID=509963 RepID=UPI002905BF28|nr:ADP-ribosyl cyclase/cyclic ADP-ribose hydrolase-like [Ylistrum balloti]
MKCNMKDLVISVILFLYIQHIHIVECTCVLSQQRSTESFREMFMGRCLHYQTVINSPEFCSQPKNCTLLWELFLQGFAYQPPCNTSSEGFRPFVRAAYHNTPRDKHIFWSGVYRMIDRYTYGGRKLTAIDDTLIGYLVDGFDFCGSTTSADGNEVNITSCPRCPHSASTAFWSIASINYALDAKGAIKIMLNSSRSPAIRQSSFFFTKELPNIHQPNVTSAHVLLVHSIGYQPKENCSSPSVKNLTTILTSRGISTVCEEQPRDVVLLQCADFPSSTDCDNILISSGSDRQSAHVSFITAVVLNYVFQSFMSHR